MEITRIGVLSSAKIFAGIYFAIGLIIGVLSACFGLVIFGGVMADEPEIATIGGAFYLAGLCFFPITYGIIGFIAGAIVAVFYNIVAKYLGGIELDLSQKT